MSEEKKERLLIVEDNKDTQILLTYLLSESFQLDVAPSVDTALQLTSSTSYDLLLVDINLGEERTGIDLLTILRKDVIYTDIPIIALTAYAMPGDFQRFLELGFDAYLSKPFTRNDLFDIIYSFLPKRIV